MKRFNKIILYVALLIVALFIVSCSPKKENNEVKIEDTGNKVEQEDKSDDTASDLEKEVSYPIEIEDKFGNKVTIEKELMKIISLAPNNTETLFALGLGDKVIGVTSNCDYPQEAKSKEIIGDYNGTNLERIVELKPDLVLVYGPGSEEDNKIFKEAGINVLGFMSENIDGVLNDIEVIGKATGNNKEASALIKSMNEKKDSILAKVKSQNEVKVFYEIWHDPLMAAGKGSFMDELITLVGGKNIAEDAEGAYPSYDLEQLIERNPDVFMAAQDSPDKTVESVKLRPGFNVISAIKNDRVTIFVGDAANIVSRPGPRIIEALELVAKAIYPEAFK